MFESGSKKHVVVAGAVGALAAAAFVGWHSLDLYRALAPIYRRTPPGSPIHDLSLARQVVGYAVVALALYVGFVLAGSAIAVKTRDLVLWALPAMLYVFSPLPGMLLFRDRASLRPILDPYGAPGTGTGGWRWLFALADLVLVLAPAAVIALGQRKRGESRARADWAARGAFIVCAALGFALYLRQQYVANGSFDVNVEAHLMLGIVFVIGASMGVRRPWFPFVHTAVAFCLSEAVFVLINIGTSLAVGSALHMVRLAATTMAPTLTAVGLGALSDPLARYLRSRGARSSAELLPA